MLYLLTYNPIRGRTIIKQLFYFFIYFVILLTSCTNQEKKDPYHFTLKGMAVGYTNDTLYIEQVQFGYNKPVDTTITSANGEFEVSGNIREIGVYEVKVGKEYFMLLLDTLTNGEVTFHIDSIEQTIRFVAVPECDLLNKYYSEKRYKERREKEILFPSSTFTIDSLNAFNLKAKERLKKNGGPTMMTDGTFVGIFDSLFNDLFSKTPAFFSNMLNPQKIYRVNDSLNLFYNESFTLLVDYLYKKPFERQSSGINFSIGNGVTPKHNYKAVSTVQNLTKAYPANIFLKELKENIEKLEDIIKKDSIIKVFTLKNDLDKDINLGDIKNKIIVLFFWSSANKFAPIQIQRLKSMYAKYKERDIVILTIANDKNPADWFAALEKNKMGDFINLNDPQGKESAVLKAYNVTFLPGMVLIRDRKIIHKDIITTTFEKKLQNEIDVVENTDYKKVKL